MTELDQIWSQMLDHAAVRAQESGNREVADYLRLKATNDAIRAQIHHQAAEADLREAGLKNGMTLMRDDGERLVQAGITTREELVRVTRD